MTIRIGLADDQPLFRAGIRMIIESQTDFTVAWEASDGREAVASNAASPVDIVLMDLEMPVLDGVGATELILAAADSEHAARVVVLTTFELNEKTFRAVQAGASGFLLKNADPEFLLASLRTIQAGTAVVAPSVMTELVKRFGRTASRVDGSTIDRLTPRERDIFGLIAQGMTNSEIAADRHLSDATVKTHVSRILMKLNVRDRVQLVIFAYENGLVAPADQPE